MRLYCVAETTGPMLLVASRGSPTTTFLAAAAAIAAASSIRAAGTSMRVGALHDWPEFVHIAAMSREITASKSASSRMMLADLPPSSCATRLTVGAAARATSMPARVEPVNDTMSTSGCAASGAPTLTPSPLTRLNTPGGHAGRVHDLGEEDRVQRRDLGRLEHHRAAGRDRRRDLAGDLVQRPVPRRDHSAHADGLAHDQRGAHRPLELEVGQHARAVAR